MANSIPKDSLNPIIDLDFLVYRAGFAADTQAKEEYGTEVYLESEYLSWALHNVSVFLDNLLSETFKNHQWCRMFIGGEGNYRDSIAKTIPAVVLGWKYKGNRDNLHKPKYYAEIREYMVERWGAQKVDGRESDDAAGCLQFSYTDRSTCIVSQDKDMLLIPGNLYNPIKKEFKYSTLKDADLAFRHMTLTGDRADNIPGLTGIGEVKANRLMKECDHDLKEIDRRTLQLYRTEFGHELGEGVMSDTRHLLWIQRKENILYNGKEIGRD